MNHARQTRQRFLWVALLSFFVSACGGGSSGGATPARATVDAGLLTSQNLDPDTIQNLSDAVAAGAYGEIHGLLISRNGFLIHEEYFRGYSRNQTHVCFSVTKSITSALVGVAMSQGFITDTSLNVLDALPPYAPIANLDSRKDDIELEHLLRMRAGLMWDEWSTSYEDPTNDAVRLAESPDWVQHMLDLPMEDAPGDRFVYNSGATMLLSAIIESSTGQSAEDFADVYLFGPLGITDWLWEEGPNGISNTGWGLHLRPRDMLAFGELFLNDGAVGGTQVVPAGWIDAGKPDQNRISPQSGLTYGYQWWGLSDASTIVQGLAVNDVYFANGYGGQFIIVVPHLEMVVVMTAGNFDDSLAQIFLISDYVFPAVTD